MPFSDPLADGPTIQRSTQKALNNGVTLDLLFDQVAAARAQGLSVPVVLMGYYNPLLIYGLEHMAARAAASRIDGFIVVDLPAEAAAPTLAALNKHGLSFVPLITPTTTDARIHQLVATASSFVYCVSLVPMTGSQKKKKKKKKIGGNDRRKRRRRRKKNEEGRHKAKNKYKDMLLVAQRLVLSGQSGVTGQRASVNTQLPNFLARIRKATTLPVAVGFGISQVFFFSFL